MSWIDNSPVSVWERDQAAAAEPGAPLAEPAVFREAMSRLGAAVHIVTTSGKAGRAGFTATAVASVSDSPPTVLVCLNRKSQITPDHAREQGVLRQHAGLERRRARQCVRRPHRRVHGRALHARRLDHARNRRTGAHQCDRGTRLPGARNEIGRRPTTSISARSRRSGSPMPRRRWCITRGLTSTCEASGRSPRAASPRRAGTHQPPLLEYGSVAFAVGTTDD